MTGDQPFWPLTCMDPPPRINFPAIDASFANPGAFAIPEALAGDAGQGLTSL